MRLDAAGIIKDRAECKTTGRPAACAGERGSGGAGGAGKTEQATGRLPDGLLEVAGRVDRI